MPASITITSNGVQPWNRVVTVGFDASRFIECDIDSNVRNLLSGRDRTDPAVIEAAASDWFQMLVDVGPDPANPRREVLADLQSQFPDDPDFQNDPALPHRFWARVVPGDQLGNGQSAVDIYRPVALVGGVATHIISRQFLVTFVWNGGTEYAFLTEQPPTVLR